VKLSIPRYEDGAIGLPEDGSAITITNTERRRLACTRSWWFADVERLRLGSTRPQKRGSTWHEMLEDLHRWWMENESRYPEGGIVYCPFCSLANAERCEPREFVPDGLEALVDLASPPSDSCERCGGTGLGALARYRLALSESKTEDGTSLLSAEEIAEEVSTLAGMWEGWAETYGLSPSRTYQVVAVEVAIARPILNPRTKKPYRPEVFVVTEPDGSERLAATGEQSGAVPLPDGASLRSVRYPWFQIGRLDCVLRHRRTGVFYVGEWKSSASPQLLVQDLAIDPQTDGYCWLLEHAVQREAFGVEDESGSEVVGYIYDVASTAKQSHPRALSPQKVKALNAAGEPYKLKGRWVYEEDANGDPVERSPGFSRGAATIPSWRWRRALAASPFSVEDYAEQIDDALQRIDPKLYVREWGVSSAEARLRYAEEIFAVAVQISGLRRAAARARFPEDLNVAFPRTPICRMPGGYCSYRSPCLLDGEEARESFEVAPSLAWSR
jgi:hypothetical protein